MWAIKAATRLLVTASAGVVLMRGWLWSLPKKGSLMLLFLIGRIEQHLKLEDEEIR